MSSDNREDAIRLRKWKRRIRYLTGVAMVIFVFSGAYSVFFSRYLRVETVQAQVRDDLDRGVDQEIWRYINAKKTVFIPKTNVLFLGRDELSADIKHLFPEIESVTYTYKVPQRTLVVRATFRQTVGMLCVLDSECYAIDRHAVPFKKLDANTQNLMRIKDQTNRELQVGIPQIPEDFFEALVAYWNQGQQSLSIFTDAVLEKESLDAGYIRFETAQGWYLLVNVKLPVKDTMDKVVAVLGGQQSTSTITYIDARYTDKVYVK